MSEDVSGREVSTEQESCNENRTLHGSTNPQTAHGYTSEQNLSLVSVSPNPSQCSLIHCIDDEDQFKLQCSGCNRLVHYACTQLPVYQVSHFLTKG